MSESEFAEVQLSSGDGGDFHLLVRRSVAQAVAPAAAPAAMTASVTVPPQLSPLPSPYMSVDDAATAADSSDDEALVAVTSSKVGIFRRGKAKVVRVGVGFVKKIAGSSQRVQASLQQAARRAACVPGAPACLPLAPARCRATRCGEAKSSVSWSSSARSWTSRWERPHSSERAHGQRVAAH